MAKVLLSRRVLGGASGLSEAFLWLGIHLIPQDFSFEPVLTVVAQHGRRLGVRCPVLLDEVGAHMVLARGISQNDRFIIAVGATTAVTTFVTNKPYLGWQRHTWDPTHVLFLRSWPPPVIFDEIHDVPELLEYVRTLIDAKPR